MKLLSKQTCTELLRPLSVWQFWNHSILVVYTRSLQGSWSPERVSSAWLSCKDQWRLRTWLVATNTLPVPASKTASISPRKGAMGKELPAPQQKLAECASSSRHTHPSAKVFWFGLQMTVGCQPASALSPSPHRLGGRGGLRVTHSLLLTDEGHGAGAEASLHGLLHGLLQPPAQKSQVSYKIRLNFISNFSEWILGRTWTWWWNWRRTECPVDLDLYLTLFHLWSGLNCPFTHILLVLKWLDCRQRVIASG